MIKQFFKKVLISYLIIICCIYTPTAQAAGWSFGGYNFGNGSLNIVKDGVKITTAAVDSAPITSNLGAKILGGALRGASLINAISIIAGIGNDALDWVLDPANNRIIYYEKDANSNCSGPYSGASGFSGYSSASALCNAVKTKLGYSSVVTGPLNSSCVATCTFNNGDTFYAIGVKSAPVKTEKYIPIPTVAQKIYDMAKSGDTNAQADVTSAVTELVSAGTYDTPISQAIQDAVNNGTLPKDTDTTNPTNPNPQIDTSSIIAAIQSLASSFASAISNAFNGITSVINTSIDKLLNKQEQMQGELVNVGSKVEGLGGQVVGVGDKVDNVGGKVVGVGDAVKDVGGKVVGLNDSVDKVGDAVVGVGDKVTGVGDKVDAAGEKVGTKVDAVGEKVTTVGDKVVGVGDKVDAAGEKVGTKVDAVGEKVTTVGDKVDAAGDKVADAVKESTKEITKKMDETKPQPFELPAFCSWASKVCDFIDWVKQEPDQPEDGTLSESTKDYDWQSKANGGYVSFGGSCPAPVLIPIRYMGASTDLTISYTPFCQFATMIKPAVILSAYIAALMIISGGRTKE